MLRLPSWCWKVTVYILFLPSFVLSVSWYQRRVSWWSGQMAAVCVQEQTEVVRWGLIFAGMRLESAVRIPQFCISRSQCFLVALLCQSPCARLFPFSRLQRHTAHFFLCFFICRLSFNFSSSNFFLQIFIFSTWGVKD